jgi:methyl-accepting chemotaxis protein
VSIEITNEITAISCTIQEDAASVEEVLESMSEQNQRINSIAGSFNELNTLMNDLESIDKVS